MNAMTQTAPGCEFSPHPWYHFLDQKEHTTDWLGLYEAPSGLLCFTDANLAVLNSSLQNKTGKDPCSQDPDLTGVKSFARKKSKPHQVTCSCAVVAAVVVTARDFRHHPFCNAVLKALSANTYGVRYTRDAIM